MKARDIFLIVLLIIVGDQSLKLWVKTHMPLSHPVEAYRIPVSKYDNGIKLLGNHGQIYFVENEGMAWGWKFGGNWGKMLLTLFRLFAVIFGIFYIRTIIEKKYHRGFILCAGLIFAGALGNLIDSMFYGLIFEESTYDHVARLFPAHGGYAGFLHGRVVDMLYFPIIRTHYPHWFPYVGGQEFEFFSPVFNLADASISVGVIAILVFQKKFFHNRHEGGDTGTGLLAEAGLPEGGMAPAPAVAGATTPDGSMPVSTLGGSSITGNVPGPQAAGLNGAGGER